MCSFYKNDETDSSVITALEAQLQERRPNGKRQWIGTQLETARALGCHKYVRGLSPRDTGDDYTEEEQDFALGVWIDELFSPIRERSNKLLDRIPADHAAALRYQLNKITDKGDKHRPDVCAQAVRLLLDQVERADDAALPPIDADFSDFREFANRQADNYARRQITHKQLEASNPATAAQALDADAQAVARLIDWRKPDNMDAAGFYARARDPKFWMRHAQKKARLGSIQAARVLQMLGYGYGRSEYLPLDLVKRKHQQIDLMDDWMGRTLLRTEGKELTLRQINEGAARRQLAELDIRCIAQFEKALRKGWQAHFLTVTTPSRFHSTTTRGKGKNKYSVPNPRFDSSLTALDSLNWIQGHWGRFRALAQKICGKDGWDSFGGTEGNVDATGHRHIIVYCPPGLAERMRKAAIQSFLLSDNPHEPGAKKHRVDWEPARSAGGVKKYITQILRYTLKTISEDSDKPSAEALVIKSLGRRTFSMSQDHIGHWRWLRARAHPFGLPEELVPAWAAAHGLEVNEIPTPQEYEDEQLGKYKKGIWGEITRPAHFLAFQDTAAPTYQPAWRESDYFNVEHKTLNDFLIETADQNTGEICEHRAREAYYNAWYASWEGDDSLIIKSKEPILNCYGEPKKPSGGAEKAPFLFRMCEWTGKILLAGRKAVKWVKETLPKQKAKEHPVLKIIQEKDAALQLSPRSQGAAGRASKGFARDMSICAVLGCSAEEVDAKFKSFYRQILENEARSKLEPPLPPLEIAI